MTTRSTTDLTRIIDDCDAQKIIQIFLKDLEAKIAESNKASDESSEL